MAQFTDDIVSPLLRNLLQQRIAKPTDSSFLGLPGLFDNFHNSHNSTSNASFDGIPPDVAAFAASVFSNVYASLNSDIDSISLLNRLSNFNTSNLAPLLGSNELEEQLQKMAAPATLPTSPIPAPQPTALEILEQWFQSPSTVSSPPELRQQSPSASISSPASTFSAVDTVWTDGTFSLDSNVQPSASRKCADVGCQTDLTLADFDSSPLSSHSPSHEGEIDSDSDSDDQPPNFAACKTPAQIYKLILKTRKDREDGQYHCPSCDRAFTRRFNLKTHYGAQHANVRNFACGSCDRSFSRRYDLQRHEKLLHGVGGGGEEAVAGDIATGGPIRTAKRRV